MYKTLFPTSVVTKAFTWAYQELGLELSQASEILGISPTSLAQTTLLGFESNTPEYRKQLAFIRMYHLLISVSEGDTEYMIRWFTQFNIALEASPFDCCKTHEGIEQVSDLLRSVKLRSELNHESYSAIGDKLSASTLGSERVRVH
jgi:hypothetical protein